MRLLDYQNDVFSQNGEDGILAQVFKIIGVRHKRCMEFGAWDGLYLSNVARLWADEGWEAILAEKDRSRFDQLVRNTSDKPVECHNFAVESTGDHSIDTILNGRELDLIVIDVDGDDWLLWKSMVCRPRVAVIEYNCSVPLGISMAQASGEYFGASAQVLIDIGRRKGYSLVEMNICNCFFVQDEYLPLFNGYELDPAKLFDPRFLVYAVSAFDRRMALTSNESAWGVFQTCTVNKIQLAICCADQGVAQSSRAPGLGPGGCRSEACHPDHFYSNGLVYRTVNKTI